MNITIEYLYRDAGNNKLWNQIIFRNDHQKCPKQLTLLLNSKLIDGQFFVATSFGFPPLSFDKYHHELDHGWHEFSSLYESESLPSDPLNRDIFNFINSLNEANNYPP